MALTVYVLWKLQRISKDCSMRLPYLAVGIERL
jgi:hypothetical protein